MFKNKSVYQFHKFEENPPSFKKLSWRSFFILFIFQSKSHFKDLLFSYCSCCEWRPCVTKFWADCTCGHISL